MKVVWSVLVGDARGKAGGVVATDTYAGRILRRQFRARATNTQTQLEMRAALGSLAALWSDPSMTSYRGDWVALGLAHPEANVFGQDIYKTGLQWFIRANKNRQTIGEAIILEAPAYAAVDDPGALTLEHVTGPPEELNLDASTPPALGDAVVIFATRPLSPGILTLGHQQRKLLTINPATNPPWDILSDYTAKYGTPHDGTQIFAEAWYMDIAQGRIGLKAQCSAIW